MTDQINGEILASDIEEALEKDPKIRAVIIVSPNYDGVVSDVRAIAKAAHRHGVVLIVDEAHGAHFGFHPYFPERANELGADIVINSLHKTLPSLTQTALLHLNGPLANRKKIRRYLGILQTSSPSYILMASLDFCVDLVETRGNELFERYAENIKVLRDQLSDLKHLKLITTKRFDPSKFVISIADTKMKSMELYKILLNDYHLQMEMVGGTYVLAMTSLADTKEGFERLNEALHRIDQIAGTGYLEARELPVMEQVMSPAQAVEAEEEENYIEVPLSECEGKIALEFAYLYPPGSPVIVPGERISKEAVELLAYYKAQEFQIEGLAEQGKIKVLDHE